MKRRSKADENYYERTIRFIEYAGFVYLQLSNSMGHFCVSSGYLCSFIGHDSVADILQQNEKFITHTRMLFSTIHRFTISEFISCSFLDISSKFQA